MWGRAVPNRECLTYIKEVWTDMRPLSLRKQMQGAQTNDSRRAIAASIVPSSIGRGAKPRPAPLLTTSKPSIDLFSRNASLNRSRPKRSSIRPKLCNFSVAGFVAGSTFAHRQFGFWIQGKPFFFPPRFCRPPPNTSRIEANCMATARTTRHS